MNSRRIVLIIAIAVIALTVTTLGCEVSRTLRNPLQPPSHQVPVRPPPIARVKLRQPCRRVPPRQRQRPTPQPKWGPRIRRGQSSGTQPQQGQTARPTATPRPATPTPSPEPAPTATSEVHTQTGGSVIMQAPTSTPTPPPTPAPAATPVPAPYWERFTTEEYNELLPPTGSIQWPKDGYCTFVSEDFQLANITPEGIKDRTVWLPNVMKRFLSARIGKISVENLIMEHPNLFDESRFNQFCGYAQSDPSKRPRHTCQLRDERQGQHGMAEK